MSRMVYKEQGFSMLEILVALVISLVTLMGASGLVVRTVQQEVEASQRLQALTLAQDMADRIQINRRVATCYSNGANGVNFGKGIAENSLPDCTAGSAAENSRANDDLSAWHNSILGASVQTEDNANVGAMIHSRGCITQVNAVNRTYRVTVVWQGMSETRAPAVACGQNAYSSEAARRAINLVVQIGDLT